MSSSFSCFLVETHSNGGLVHGILFLPPPVKNSDSPLDSPIPPLASFGQLTTPWAPADQDEPEVKDTNRSRTE